jgi:hypothetical protein
VPARATDVELELIGYEYCRGLVHARRRIYSDAFGGPRLLLHVDDAILEIGDEPDRSPDGSLLAMTYATDHEVVRWTSSGAVRIAAPFARDIVQSIATRLVIAWIEGAAGETSARLRTLAGTTGQTMDVSPGARLFRLAIESRIGEGLLLVEPGRARELSVDASGACTELRSFALPDEIVEPRVQRETLLARDETSRWRGWDLRDGSERADLAGLDEVDAIIQGRPSVVFVHDGAFVSGIDPLSPILAVPDWAFPRPRAGDGLLARIGPPLAAVPIWFDDSWVVIGRDGALGVVVEPPLRTRELFADTSSLFGGPIRVARHVGIQEALVVADDGRGGSSIFHVGSDARGFEPGTCAPWSE